MDARRSSESAATAAMSVEELKMDAEADRPSRTEPPSYRDIMPRRPWLPPGAAASSLTPIITTPASPVSVAQMSPLTPHAPLGPVLPMSPRSSTHTLPVPPPPLTPESLTPPPVPPPVSPRRSTFASLRLVGDDGIRVSGFPSTIAETIESTLQKGWRGIRDSRASGDAYEWTLDGAPWSTSTPSFASHRLLEYILFTLSKAGWQVAISPTLPAHRRDSFVFRSSLSRERLFFTVLFDRFTIQLLDGPLEAREVLRDILDAYPSAPPTEKQPRVLRFVMTGRTDDPWVEKPEMASEVMCALLAGLEGVGYVLVTAFDIVGGSPRVTNSKVPSGGSLGDAWVFASR